jgi:hypothetical protein
MLLAIALLGCGVDYTNVAQDRYLDSYSYVDAGAVNIGERQTFTVPLFSKADGAIKIFEIMAEDLRVPMGQVGTAFLVDDNDWASPECDDDGDGVGDCLELTGYDADSDSDTLALAARFAPEVAGYYEGILTIWSNDSRTSEKAVLPSDPEGLEFGIWRVQLRGISRPACGRVYPTFIDFGRRAAGGDFAQNITMENCGLVSLTVSDFEVGNTLSMYSNTLAPLYVLPGNTEPIAIGWTVGANTDDAPTPDGATVTFSGNSKQLSNISVSVIGNDCSQSTDPSWDNDGDGWFYCGGDCDDDDPYVNPSVVEVEDDGIDNDCDGAVDEAANPIGTDDDGDGYNESGSMGGAADCDDADPDVHPGAVEVLNQIDDDCNGIVDDQTEGYDDDGDGFSERMGDCDDTNPLYYPGAPEEPTDGIDNDCDGEIDEGGPYVDDDLDGYADIEDDPSVSDCDDNDPWVYVGAREYCDGYDNDCDGLVDEGNEEDEGGLDAEGGACAFLPERDTVASSAVGDSGAESGGCSVVSVGPGVAGAVPPTLLVTVLAGLLVPRRRRE